MTRSCLCSALLLATTVAAAAQSQPPDSVAEARRQLQEVDGELNSVYARCVDPEQSTVQSINALRQSQREWLGVRDGTARAYQLANSDRRPLDDEYYLHGLAVMTRSRIEELRTLFGCN
ncbi:MAG: lysozyme inhibitor LprI family protein [Hyphomicrobium sp.]